MAPHDTSRDDLTNVLGGSFGRDLGARRRLHLELPEFLIYALEARVAEANEDAPPHDRCTVEDYIESELVNLVTLRDVAELDAHLPGFAEAVHAWIVEMRP